MESPSYGARSRHRTLHLASSRETSGRHPYRSALEGLKLPRTPQGRANRRDWWMTWVIIPCLLMLGAIVLIISEWRPHPGAHP